MNHNLQVLLQLNLVPKIGAFSTGKILSFVAIRAGLPRDFFSSIDFDASKVPERACAVVCDLSLDDLIRQVGLSPESAQLVYDAVRTEKALEKEMKLLERNGIKLATLLDDHYPELLRVTHAAPAVLYVQGAQLERRGKRLAVVGARIADDYAQAVLSAILPDIIAYDWEIVSGGALGADTFAHEITVRRGGKTIVVLGSGLLSWYPTQNKKLFQKVIDEGGSIISMFSLESPPDSFHFPMRNRVISGLSQGCVVVQAARKSGALITAQYAVEQGRQIFAVPGSLFSPLSEGCHDLIFQGASIVTSAKTILDALDSCGEGVQTQLSFTTPANMSVPLPRIDHDHNFKRTKKENEHPLLAHFHGPMTLDQLSEKSSHQIVELQDMLFTLSLEGAVKQNFAGLWERL